MRDSTTKFYKPNGYQLRRNGEAPWFYTDGVVPTQHGYVRVDCSHTTEANGKKYKPWTRLTFIHAGAQHERVLDRAFSHRRLVTLADRFVQEVMTHGVTEVDRG